MLQKPVSLTRHRSASDAVASPKQPAETGQHNHREELQGQSWLHWFSLPPTGKGWEDPRGGGRMVPPSSPSPPFLPSTVGTIPLSLRSLFPWNGMGGRARRSAKGRWEDAGASARRPGGLRGPGELREPCGATLLARPSARRCARGAGRGILDIALVRAESIIEKMRVHYRFWPWSACLGRRLG